MEALHCMQLAKILMNSDACLSLLQIAYGIQYYYL